MNSNSNNNSQYHLIDIFVKKVLAHLDEQDPNKLMNFLQLFQSSKNMPPSPTVSKVVYNSMPFADPSIFLTMWSQQVVQTQHIISALDFHVIPTGASNTIICNVNCKVRFDESGRDKMGQDSVIPMGPSGAKRMNNNRPLWGSYFGVSLQLCLDDRIFRNDINGVITSLNYKIVYKPEDSLIKINWDNRRFIFYMRRLRDRYNVIIFYFYPYVVYYGTQLKRKLNNWSWRNIYIHNILNPIKK